MLVDSHCHLDYLARDGDLDDVVTRARTAGVGTLVTICTKLSEFETVLGIAERYDNVFCSVGVHPHEAEPEGLRDPDRLIALTAHDKVVGIGETGLDYYYEHSPRPRQIDSFQVHIEAAHRTGLPLIVHARDADDDLIRVLRAAHRDAPFTGVIHCFTAGAALAHAALDLGLYISIAGIVTFKKADDLRAVVRDVPLERLLVETDSPYLAPVPKRGKRNEPAYVAHTAAALAELKDVPVEDIARTTTENAFNLFTKVTRPASAAPTT